MSIILVVEDEPAVQRFVGNALPTHDLHTAHNIDEAMLYLREQAVDLVLLDLQLGSEDGMEIAQFVRERWPYTAVVILTGQGSLQSAMKALEVEAQAYLLKPIKPDELRRVVQRQIERMKDIEERDALASHMKAAISALQQESTHRAEMHRVRDTLRMDRYRYEATYNGLDLNLSPAQFRVLWCLVGTNGEPVSPQELVREALGYEASEIEASDLIKSYILQIRRKLEAVAGAREYIRTIRGAGYLWVGG